MRKILITGITGFVGGHLTNFLLNNTHEREIFGTTRSLIDRDDPTYAQVTLFHVDLNQKKDVFSLIETVKPDEVYHLAALSSPAESYKAPSETIENNINGQIHLLDALREYDLKETRVIIVTSSDVYGLVEPSNIPINEETSFHPSSPYAVSKITQDFLAMQYFHSYKMPIVRVRPFAHVGPKQTDKFVLASFAKQIASIEKRAQEPVMKVGNLDAKRDFTDVRDMVRAYALLMEKGVPGDVYNVGSGESRKIAQVLDALLAYSSIQIATETDEERIRPSDIPELCCDYTKMHELTGWKPEIPFERTLEDILNYWRETV